MNKICNEKECTGCMACYNICPQKCIEMKYNEFGELSPTIDEKRCINCNLCRKVCPNNNKIIYNEPENAYAAWSIDTEDRKSSTSGGMASIFYQNAVKNGYTVFGTFFDEELILKHSYTNKQEDLSRFKGSKYCQSNVQECYKKIKDIVKENGSVLFIGTPCQISGLNSYSKNIGINTEKLITVDLVCHGVPSQKYLSEYIKYIEKTKGKKANKIVFRDSEQYIFKLLKDEEVIYSKIREKDLYLTAFQLSVLQRDCCLECKYAKSSRVSDITIGDFWGINVGKNINNEEKEKGISLVLINTKKGKAFFNDCKEKIFYEERKLQEAIEGNAHLRRPSQPNKYREKFRDIYKNDNNFVNSIKQVLKKEIKIQRRNYILVKLKNKIKKIIRK